MAGTTMTLGTWKRRVGDSVDLRKVPELLDMTPKEVGNLVKRKALPVYTFRTRDGITARRVRRSDLEMVKASLRKPKLCDLISAFEIMASQP